MLKDRENIKIIRKALFDYSEKVFQEYQHSDNKEELEEKYHQIMNIYGIIDELDTALEENLVYTIEESIEKLTK